MSHDPWEAPYPLASLGTVGRRPGAVPAFALAGALFALLAVFLVVYAVLERDARDNVRFHSTGPSLGPAAYLVPPPGQRGG